MGDDDEHVNGHVMGVPFTIKGVNMGLLVTLVIVMSFTGYLIMIRSTAEHHDVGLMVQQQTAALKEQAAFAAAQAERQAKAAEEQNFMLFYATEQQKQKIREAKKVPETLKELLR